MAASKTRAANEDNAVFSMKEAKYSITMSDQQTQMKHDGVGMLCVGRKGFMTDVGCRARKAKAASWMLRQH